MVRSKEQLIREFRCGQIYAAVLRRPRVRDGRAWVEYSVRILRRFKNERSNGVSTSTYFRVVDLPRLAAVASKAFQFISVREYGDEMERDAGTPSIAVEDPAAPVEPNHSQETNR